MNARDPAQDRVLPVPQTNATGKGRLCPGRRMATPVPGHDRHSRLRKCAVHTRLWSCRKPDEAFVNGHRRSASQTGNHDFDSWSHFQGHGTHAAMVISHPWSGLQQGAEDYLRSTARRPGVSPRVVQRIQDALDRWDARS